MTDYLLYEELDKVYNKTMLKDSILASSIREWSQKRGMRILDSIAVAYRLGYSEGRKSNQERINKAFLKLYAGKAPGEAAIKQPADSDAEAANGDPQREESKSVNNDVITPNGNEEVEDNAESEE